MGVVGRPPPAMTREDIQRLVGAHMEEAERRWKAYRDAQPRHYEAMFEETRTKLQERHQEIEREGAEAYTESLQAARAAGEVKERFESGGQWKDAALKLMEEAIALADGNLGVDDAADVIVHWFLDDRTWQDIAKEIFQQIQRKKAKMAGSGA
jgi:flagellar biosynthesis/type III secretory pathway protein FliH